MEQGGTTSTKRSQNGPMEPPDHNRPLPMEPSVPTDIDQKLTDFYKSKKSSTFESTHSTSTHYCLIFTNLDAVGILRTLHTGFGKQVSVVFSCFLHFLFL